MIATPVPRFGYYVAPMDMTDLMFVTTNVGSNFLITSIRFDLVIDHVRSYVVVVVVVDDVAVMHHHLPRRYRGRLLLFHVRHCLLLRCERHPESTTMLTISTCPIDLPCPWHYAMSPFWKVEYPNS